MTDTREAPTIRAPRGRDLTCKGWHQEAALRMLMNNLDPEVAERPEDLVVYGGTGKAARNWESFWRHRQHAARPRRRRNPARAVGQARSRLPNTPVGPAGPDRQLPAGSGMGRLGDFQGAGAGRAHDVRADDRGVLDLHRHPGHPAGHLRDIQSRRRTTLRRNAAGPRLPMSLAADTMRFGCGGPPPSSTGPGPPSRPPADAHIKGPRRRPDLAAKIAAAPDGTSA